MLRPGNSYEAVYKGFQWEIPQHYNIGVDICDKWAHQKSRLALIYEREDGGHEKYTFGELKTLSNRFANALTALGLQKSDRVGIFLSQSIETAITHIATYKIGGIAIPLFTLFGPDALEYRLCDSEAKCVVTDRSGFEKITKIWSVLPLLEHIIVVEGNGRGQTLDFWSIVDKGSDSFRPVKTAADDPALIIYTSGTTGQPKGALHAHRVLPGHLPGVEFPHNFFPKPGDCFWTPADWAWIGGLIDVLFPSWHHGIPVVAHRARKFDPEHAFYLMAKHNIRNLFLPPTALKIMRQVKLPKNRHDYHIRSIGSGGETLGVELLEWGKETFGVYINEFYGQTEANLVVGNCAKLMKNRPGSMGKAIPGHVVEIVDDEGNVLPPDSTGNIAIRHPDPVIFLKYWKRPNATRNKYVGDWCITGDLAKKDSDGYFWFVGREDDIITSAGYRIGPGEIEDCLIRHPAVIMAGVVGKPDPVRTEIIKAFIVLKPGIKTDLSLQDELKNFVKDRLAAHEYPREIEFVDQLPMTATGKIIRKQLRELKPKK